MANPYHRLPRDAMECPTPETDCGETCWSDQLGDSTTVFPKRWTFQSPKLVQGGRIIAISNPSKFCYDLQETGKCVFGRLQNALLQAPKRTHSPKTNAFSGARKMHFVTLPERMLWQTMPQCGCGPSFT